MTVETFDQPDSLTLGPVLTWSKFPSVYGPAYGYGGGPDDGETLDGEFAIYGGDRSGLQPGARECGCFARAEEPMDETQPYYVEATITALDLDETGSKFNDPWFYLGVSLDPAYDPASFPTKESGSEAYVSGPTGIWLFLDAHWDVVGPTGSAFFAWAYNATTDELYDMGDGSFDVHLIPTVEVGDVVRLTFDPVDMTLEVFINGVSQWSGTVEVAGMDDPIPVTGYGGLGLYARWGNALFNTTNYYVEGSDRWDNFTVSIPTPTPPADPEDDPPRLTVQYYTFPDLENPLDLDLSNTIPSFVDELSAPGSGKLVVLRTDPVLADIQLGDIVQYSVTGLGGASPTVGFSAILEHYHSDTIMDGEEEVEVVEFSGRGLLAALERAVVFPSNGVGHWPIQEDRNFNFTEPGYTFLGFEFDDSAWDTPEDLCSTGFAATSWVGAIWADDEGRPSIPDSDARVVTAPGNGLDTAEAPQTDYFRFVFDAPYTGDYFIFFAADDTVDFWIDGSPIGTAQQRENFRRQNMEQFQLDSTVEVGSHVFAARVTNNPWADPTANPTGIAWAIYAPGQPLELIAHSDAISSKVLRSDDVIPGMTPGHVLLTVLFEAVVVRGHLSYFLDVDLPFTGFTSTVDSDGTSWPVVADLATKVGTDLLTFFIEVAQTYVDIWIDPTNWQLQAWVKDARTAASGLTLTEGVNLTALSHEGELVGAGEFLVRYAGGWAVVGDGEPEVLLGLGADQSLEEVTRVGTSELAEFDAALQQVDFGYEPMSNLEIPYVNENLFAGSTVTVPDKAGNPTSARVISIACTIDDDSGLVVGLTLGDITT